MVFAGVALVLAVIPSLAVYFAVHTGNTIFITISGIFCGTPTHYMLFIAIAALTGYRCADGIDALMHGYIAVMFFDCMYGSFCWLVAFLPFSFIKQNAYSVAQYMFSWHIVKGTYWFYLELVLIAFIAYGGYRLRKLHAHGRLRDFLAGPLLIASITIVTLIFISGLVQWFGYAPARISTVRSATSILFAVITFIWLIHEYPSDARVCPHSDE